MMNTQIVLISAHSQGVQSMNLRKPCGYDERRFFRNANRVLNREKAVHEIFAVSVVTVPREGASKLHTVPQSKRFIESILQE